VALKEARKRIGDNGLYVVGDAAHLPFASGALDGAISLHTIHHVPLPEQERAFREFVRVLKPGGAAVAVYNWGRQSFIGRFSKRMAGLAFTLRQAVARLRGRDIPRPGASQPESRPQKTYVEKHDVRWARGKLGDLPGFEIRVWRTFSVPFMKAVIHPSLGGKQWLRLLYFLEQLAPHFLGRHGTYPMLIFRRPGIPDTEAGQRSEA
jgi:SAM-dependent methyltransferase